MQRAKAAEARADKIAKEIKSLQEAYYEEAQHLAELATGTNDERFSASIDILRALSGSGGDTD